MGDCFKGLAQDPHLAGLWPNGRDVLCQLDSVAFLKKELVKETDLSCQENARKPAVLTLFQARGPVSPSNDAMLTWHSTSPLILEKQQSSKQFSECKSAHLEFPPKRSALEIISKRSFFQLKPVYSKLISAWSLLIHRCLVVCFFFFLFKAMIHNSGEILYT